MPRTLIDLTHLLNETISAYPDTIGPKFESLNTVEKSGFAELKATMVLHSGTHVDAPSHMLKDGKSLDQFPIEKFVGTAIVIPCLDKNEIDVGYLQTFEANIAHTDFILFFTGWQYKWNTREYFDDSPIPTGEAARWLTRFKLKGIGYDAFSVDKVISAEKITAENMPNHHILLGKEIILIENLTNLDKLPGHAFSFQCLPLKVEHADGSPVRAIAVIEE